MANHQQIVASRGRSEEGRLWTVGKSSTLFSTSIAQAASGEPCPTTFQAGRRCTRYSGDGRGSSTNTNPALVLPLCHCIRRQLPALKRPPRFGQFAAKLRDSAFGYFEPLGHVAGAVTEGQRLGDPAVTTGQTTEPIGKIATEGNNLGHWCQAASLPRHGVILHPEIHLLWANSPNQNACNAYQRPL